jgi:hypothetical protein
VFVEDVVAVCSLQADEERPEGEGSQTRPWTMILRHALPERIIEARWETIHDPLGASF